MLPSMCSCVCFKKKFQARSNGHHSKLSRLFHILLPRPFLFSFLPLAYCIPHNNNNSKPYIPISSLNYQTPRQYLQRKETFTCYGFLKRTKEKWTMKTFTYITMSVLLFSLLITNVSVIVHLVHIVVTLWHVSFLCLSRLPS